MEIKTNKRTMNSELVNFFLKLNVISKKFARERSHKMSKTLIGDVVARSLGRLSLIFGQTAEQNLR